MRVLVGLLIFFLVSLSNVALANEQAKTMAQCAFVAVNLGLEQETTLFTQAYLKLRSIEQVDRDYEDRMFFTEGLIMGYAAAKNETPAKVYRDFYYEICSGSVERYANDLTNEDR